MTLSRGSSLDFQEEINYGSKVEMAALLPSFTVHHRLTCFPLFAALAVSALAQSSLERAVTLTRQKQYAEARKALEGVTEPLDIRQRIAFHRLRAAIASGLGDQKIAAEEIRRALDLAPGDPALLLATSLAELQAGLFDDALAHAQKAGKSAQAEALIGDIQEKRGKFVEAANAYQIAVELAPNNEQYRIALALELVQHQSFTPAVAVLEQATRLFPKSGRIWTLLGIAQYGDGDSAAAVTSLVQAIAVDPKLEPAYNYVTRIVLDSSASPPEQALKPLCAWKATVCSALKLRIAKEKDDSELRSEAIAGLKRAAAGDVIARCELGRAYEWTGQLTDARREMEECVRLEPSPQNRYRLVLIYHRLGLTELANRQMALRKKSMDNLSEDAERRAQAVQTFEYVLK